MFFLNFSSLFSCLFDFSLQGLAHLKAEQGTLSSFFVDISFIYLFFSSLTPVLVVSCKFTVCTCTTCPFAFACCCAATAERWGGGGGMTVCVCLAQRGAQQHGMSHISPLSLSRCARVCPQPRFIQVSVYYIIVYYSHFHSKQAVTRSTVWERGWWGWGEKKQGSSGVGLGVDKEITGIWGDSSEEKEAYLG